MRARGFTIIEAVIVTVVVGILSVVSIVAIPAQIKSIKLNNLSDKMVSDFLYAQYIANGTGQFYGISIEVDPINVYSIYTTNGTTDTIVLDPSDKTNNYTIYANTDYGIKISSVSITGGGKKIEFRPDGTPFTDKSQSPANPLTSESIVTLSNGVTTRTVRITPNTGRIYEQ